MTKRDAARLTVAKQATNADDLRQLLDMLGLWPHQDHLAETTNPQPTPQFHTRIKQRKWSRPTHP